MNTFVASFLIILVVIALVAVVFRRKLARNSHGDYNVAEKKKKKKISHGLNVKQVSESSSSGSESSDTPVKVLKCCQGHVRQFAVVSRPSRLQNSFAVASVANDRTVRVVQSEKLDSEKRINLGLETATAITMSQTGKELLVATESGAIVGLRLLDKRDESNKMHKEMVRFSTPHRETIHSLALAENGSVLCSCSSETTVFLWSVKGSPLGSINTNQLKNSVVRVTSNLEKAPERHHEGDTPPPAAAIIAVAAWTGEVGIWRAGGVQKKPGAAAEFEVTRIATLKGHGNMVYDFGFVAERKLAVTLSKDGTYRVWNLDRDLDRGADPQCLRTGDAPEGARQLRATGSRVVFMGDRRIRAVDLDTGAQTQSIDVSPRLVKPGDCLNHIEVVNGNTIFTSSQKERFIHMWNLSS